MVGLAPATDGEAEADEEGERDGDADAREGSHRQQQGGRALGRAGLSRPPDEPADGERDDEYHDRDGERGEHDPEWVERAVEDVDVDAREHRVMCSG